MDMIDYNQLVGLFLGLVIGIPIGRFLEDYFKDKRHIIKKSSKNNNNNNNTNI